MSAKTWHHYKTWAIRLALTIIVAISVAVIAQKIWLSSYSNVDHGNTLAEVMEGLRREDVEVLAAFTSNGKKLFEYTESKKKNVRIQERHEKLLDDYEGLIILHNHPTAEEASFSSSDLKCLAERNAAYGIVVSKNRSYVLAANGRWGWASQITEYIERRSDQKKKLLVEDEKGESFITHVTDKSIMSGVAEEFGMEYYEWPIKEASSVEISDAIIK